MDYLSFIYILTMFHCTTKHGLVCCRMGAYMPATLKYCQKMSGIRLKVSWKSAGMLIHGKTEKNTTTWGSTKNNNVLI